jgi:translocation and assembly module TamB
MTIRRRILRLVVVILSVLALVAVTAVLILRSSRFHRYALGLIVAQAQQATGGRVEIGDFGFRWSGLRIDFYRVALHGTESDAGGPLLWADHIALGLRVGSWYGRDIRLNDLEIDHPVVRLSVDARGHSNLPEAPRPPSSGPSSPGPADVFQLAVRYAGINRGDIYYNDAHVPLQAQVKNLKAEASLGAGATYQGSLSYQNAVIHSGDLHPLAHDLDAHFAASPSGITISSLVIHCGASSITGQAKVTDYSNPSIEGSYQATLSGSELGRALSDPSLPSGMVETKGTVSYHGRPGVPLIEALEVSGTFGSALLTVEVPQARTAARAVSGEYRLSQGDLEAVNLKANVLGGSVTGRLHLAHLAGTPAATLAATVRDISLTDARSALRAPPPQAEIVAGRLNGTLEASWRGSMEDLAVRSDATVTGSAAPSPQAGSGGTAAPVAAIPVDGTVHLAYDGRRQVLSLTDTTLHTPHTGLTVDGSLGRQASLRLNAQSSDLREVDLLVFTLRSAGPAGSATAPVPQLLGLSGSASFSGTIQGSLSAPLATGRVTAANFRLPGAAFKAFDGNVSLGPSGIAIRQGTLQEGAEGSARFDLSVGLRDWSYSPQSPISLQLAAQRLQVADLERMVHLQYPVSGMLSVNLNLSGSEASPAGQGSAQLTRGQAWNQPIENLNVKFQGSGNDLHSTLTVLTSAGSATATLSYNLKAQSYDVQAQAPGVRLDRLAPLAGQSAQITGMIAVAASGRGTLKDPQLKATLDASQLHVGDQDLSGLKAQVDIANQQAHLTFASTVSGASLQADGTVSLAGRHQAHVTVESQPIQLGPLLAAFLPQAPAGLAGQTQIHATLDGPLDSPDQVTAAVEIPSLSLSYQSLQISSAAPIHIEYRKGVLNLQHAELKGTGTDLQLQGAVPITVAGNVQMSAKGAADLHLIGLLNQQFRTSGRVELDLSAQGNGAHPDITGAVRLANVSALPVGAPIGLEQVNGELAISGGRVEIKSLSGQSGGGTITARGFLTYTPSPQFNLGLTAKDVRLLYPNGVRSETDAELNLTGTPAAAALNGQVFIDQLSLTQSFDLANFSNQFSGPSTVSPASFQQNVKLNVAVLSREQMSVQNSQLNFQGSANLQVRGTLAEPVILGRTTIESGEVFFQGRRYVVQSGVIQFVNPVETEAVVNLVATTTVQQFDLTLNFVGPLDRLRTTYTSDPPLSPVDIINLLVAGHTTEAAQTSASTPQSLVAQGLSSGVSSRVQKLVGISSLTIDPQIGGNQGNAGSQLAIQQRVTKNLFFTFATDVTTTQGEVVQVEYQISRKYSVSAVRDQTGGYQVQVKTHKVF